ncbi:MAG: acyltransferase, partial [Methylococcaceae bacterium]
MRYRSDLDGLRALAVIPVVLFHAGYDWIPGGFVGVDIFFVISGYLISSIISREMSQGTFTFLGFYERRLRRIIPALLIVLFATLSVGYFLLLPDEYI